MTDSVSKPDLVGRSAEIRAIDRTMQALGGGTGGVLMCSGEPGIGKSTLAAYAASKAELYSASNYWGYCWEAGGAPAYWPWTQLLRSLVEDWALNAAERRSLSLLLPEFQDEDQAAEELQPDQARFLLLDSVRMLLTRISAETPLVLIFEDLHAADQDTLRLLQHLARHTRSLPILLIGTFREIEARASEGSAFLSGIEREATVLRLSRLSRDEVAEYLQGLSGSEVGEAQLREWFATTSGNPLFLTELAELMGRDESRLDTSQALPATVEQVIRQQISYLPEALASLLSSASVLGKAFSLDEVSSLLDRQADDVAMQLDGAVQSGILVQDSPLEYEYSHGLYREVLYRELSHGDRSGLHQRYASVLRDRVVNGDADGWSILAAHLAGAGSDFRHEAIDAWRHAARRASQRLAFDDAAAMLCSAIESFGEGPKSEPTDRCELLIECGETMMLAGDIEAGHQRCIEAFEIARALEDPVLMAQAALTYGSAIIVASVDSTLIHMLQDALKFAPASDVLCKARVQARLAAALQPSTNPVEPMEMARDAIARTRECGNEDVLYDVMRYAIAALMDFAPNSERLALNKEVLGLAEARGDIPMQFRSNLRILIDASGLGDREGFDRAIEGCENIARRIALPHYMWRALSVRAMQKTIEGQYEQASRLLDEAEAQARRVGDIEATVTIPIQRFSILCDWKSDQAMPLERIQNDLDSAYATSMAEAQFFMQPIIDTCTIRQPEDAAKYLGNREFITRSFAGQERVAIIAVSKLALLAGDFELAERAFESLLDYKDECAVSGLLGSGWAGPVALQLGKISMAMGRFEEAREFLEKAIEVSHRMGSNPYLARVHQALMELALKLDDAKGANLHREKAAAIIRALEMREAQGVHADATEASSPSSDSQSPRFGMCVEGELYKIEFNEEIALVKASKGLAMLTALVSQPDTDIHVLELSGDHPGQSVPDEGTGPALDDEARQAYKERVDALRDELEEAEELADAHRAEKAREELEFISRELSRAFGLGGRARPQAKAAERARVNVRRRISDAIKRIDQQLPGTGRYLENTIKTGTYCRYTPM